MNKKLLIVSFLIGILIISCQKNVIDQLPTGNKSLKEKVIAFMDTKKNKVGEQAKATIEELKGDIDWSDFSTSSSPFFKRNQTVFKIKKENIAAKTSENTYTCLYVTQNSSGNIVNVNTLELTVPNTGTVNLNSLALNLVNNNLQTYTGTLTKRNLSGYYIYEIEIENGQAERFRFMKKRNAGGKGQATELTATCVDWYWQTYENGVLVSEVFLFQDCSMGVEEGGSGSGGGGGTNTYDTPCDKADSLEGDAGLKAYLSALHGVTDSSFEVGFVRGHSPLGFSTYQLIQGAVGNPSLPNLSFTEPIDGLYHSHFSGGFSIFSPGDIRTMYNIYSDQMASPGFTFAVTTQTGTYVLYVDNVQQFLQYGQAHLADEASFNDFQIGTYVTNGIYESGTQLGNEIGFLKMLRDENMGLKLIEGTGTNFENWNVRGLGPINFPLNTPC